jgi:hypothetical protein
MFTIHSHDGAARQSFLFFRERAVRPPRGRYPLASSAAGPVRFAAVYHRVLSDRVEGSFRFTGVRDCVGTPARVDCTNPRTPPGRGWRWRGRSWRCEAGRSRRWRAERRARWIGLGPPDHPVQPLETGYRHMQIAGPLLHERRGRQHEYVAGALVRCEPGPQVVEHPPVQFTGLGAGLRDERGVPSAQRAVPVSTTGAPSAGRP